MTVNNDNQNPRGVRAILRALRNRNYRFFFMGQGTSLIGTWMQQVGMSWLVYRMTNSPLLLGIIAFSSQAPTFCVAPIAGVYADRFSRHKIVITTQALSMIQAIILAFLVLTHLIAVWHLIALAACLGVINGFDIPTRQAFIKQLVDRKEDLPNAIALNSMIFNGARLVGPSIAGLVIAATNEGTCFMLNAISFVAVLIALLSMRFKEQQAPAPEGSLVAGLKEGIKYAWNFVPIRMILLLLGYMSLVAMPYIVLMPVFARDILHGDSRTLGFLLGCVGIGALIGAVFLASRNTVRGLGRIIVIAVCIFGSGLIAFSFSRILLLSYALMLFVGFGVMVHMAAINTILQTVVEEDKRGRVMSLYTMSFIGMAPFGSLVVGALAGIIGAPHTLQISGALCIVAAIVFAIRLPILRKLLRPVYVEKGILPQISTGLGSATQLQAETRE
jgi:MFS family permease